MTPEARTKLKQMLKLDEGYRQFPYVDTAGKLTVAIGRNLTDRGISVEESIFMLDQDINYFHDKLQHFFPWFRDLDENRKLALINMCFNLGIQGLMNFHDMISAFEGGNMQRASDEMLNSKWAEQVGSRATRLANIIRTGEIT